MTALGIGVWCGGDSFHAQPLFFVKVISPLINNTHKLSHVLLILLNWFVSLEGGCSTRTVIMFCFAAMPLLLACCRTVGSRLVQRHAAATEA